VIPSAVRVASSATFRSLRVRNFRLYFAGQGISMCGTWMQRVAQSWLVLELTNSGAALGLVLAAQFLPMLLVGPYGGLIADRADKRRVLYATQAAQALLALVLGVVTITGLVELWMVFALAAGLGVAAVFDNPARQSFMLEMVGHDDLRNAVTLNSVLVNAARAVGPAVAGVLIATLGTGPCFLVNALSFLAVLLSLRLMDPAHFEPAEPVMRSAGQVRDGLAYVARTPALRAPLLLITVIGTLAYEFQVVLPVLAARTFHAGAGGYAQMTTAIGVGAVVGGLIVARRSHTNRGELALSAVAFGAVIVGAAVAPTFALTLVALLFVGAASVAFLALANTTLQLAAAPEMRGRVMALWAMALLGTTPIGAPIIGWIAQEAGARWALAIGGVAAILAGLAACASVLLSRRDRPARATPGATRRSRHRRRALRLIGRAASRSNRSAALPNGRPARPESGRRGSTAARSSRRGADPVAGGPPRTHSVQRREPEDRVGAHAQDEFAAPEPADVEDDARPHRTGAWPRVRATSAPAEESWS
jgi:MFS family permease